MGRTRGLIGGLVSLGAATLWLACASSYGEGFNPAESGANESTDAGGKDPFAAEAGTIEEEEGGAGGDAAPETPVDAGCAPTDCDCDDDGFNDLDKEGCSSAGGEKDCDDGDPRVRPDQGFLDAKTTPPQHGDWNCKDGIQKRFPAKTSCGIFVIGCSGKEGFEDDPACGEPGTYVTCTPLASACVAQRTIRIQECR